MISWLKTLNGKDLVTAGTTIVAIGLVYTLYTVLGNDLTHINSSIERQADIQGETNMVLRELTGVIHTNTETLRIIERRLNK